ncbi:hypothetical protein [Neobacillus fumarioli]|uniref:hypothetical protein n=1 Tax=Neobacillus fumarioli TaxID=105229 RepID=UPI000A4DD989|nr:hypothetical protein [Neobacillus fumarioli]
MVQVKVEVAVGQEAQEAAAEREGPAVLVEAEAVVDQEVQEEVVEQEAAVE